MGDVDFDFPEIVQSTWVPERTSDRVRVAIVIPCLNEALSIADVVRQFRDAVPTAVVYVFDNASTDDTVRLAQGAGAAVRHVPERGKGNVVRRMFADIDADYFLMVDGDGTYEAALAPRMLELMGSSPCDMVVACRRQTEVAAYRWGHVFGNRFFNRLLAILFGRDVQDMFSGYRLMTRRFVKTFPAQSMGFDVETELTVHALQLNIELRYAEGSYGSRHVASSSKLRTYRDGAKILLTLIRLFVTERPSVFFGALSLVFGVMAIPTILPTLLAPFQPGWAEGWTDVGLTVNFLDIAAFCIFFGLLFEFASRSRREAKIMAFLREPVPDFEQIYRKLKE